MTPGEPRVFVFADCHGWPELIVNVLRDIRTRYGGVRNGVDRLVFAGDFLDRGPRARECLDLIEALAGEALWGNHDLAILVGYEINAQDPASYDFQAGLRERRARGRLAGGPRWKLVTCAGDVLISHAGVSSDYAADLEKCGGDLTEFCRRLNAEHTRALRLELRSGRWKTARTRGKRSPTRYKLEKHGAEGLLPGVVQVIGHTPPEKLSRGHGVTPSVALDPRAVDGAALAARGAALAVGGAALAVGGAALATRSLYLVDPSVQWSCRDGAPGVRYDGPPAPGRYRYAVIQAGRVTVHESPDTAPAAGADPQS